MQHKCALSTYDQHYRAYAVLAAAIAASDAAVTIPDRHSRLRSRDAQKDGRSHEERPRTNKPPPFLHQGSVWEYGFRV